MIIQNGTIEVKRKRSVGLDADGHPNKPLDERWGKPIPCQYIPNKNLLARSNGEPYVNVSYEVLIEECPFCGEQVRLRDMCGKVLGDYSVISATPLDAVSEIRILI